MNTKILILVLALCMTASMLSVSYFVASLDTYEPVAYATQNATGQVSIISLPSISITLANDTINFGSCSVNASIGFAVLDSSQNSSTGDNKNCVTGVFPDSFVLQNDGTVDVNITASFSQNGTQYFNHSGSWLAYAARNTSVNGGCSVENAFNFTNITNTSVLYPVCGNLTSGNTTSFVEMFLQAGVNINATVDDPLIVNFQGYYLN